MENQYPKYAAGSDIDSIRTGRPIDDDDNENKKRGLLLILLIILLLLIIFFLKSCHSNTITTPPLTGEAVAEITEMSLSTDCTQVSLKLWIQNRTNKPITQTKVTYTIRDLHGNKITSTEKTIAETIQPYESYEDTEIIYMGAVYNKGIEASTDIIYYYADSPGQ